MKRNVIKVVCFCLIGCILFHGVSLVFNHSSDAERSHNLISEFYEQPDGSLDAVFLGASNVYAFFQPLLMYKEYGFTSWNYANSGRAFEITPEIIKECRKTQPDAVYVISVDSLRLRTDPSYIHFTTDEMPNSRNKWELIKKYSD